MIEEIDTISEELPVWLIDIIKFSKNEISWSPNCIKALEILKIPSKYHVEIKTGTGYQILKEYLDILSNTSVESERFFSGYSIYFESMKTRSTSSNDWISYYLMISSHKRRVLSNDFHYLLLDQFVDAGAKRVSYFDGLKSCNMQAYSKTFRK